MAVAMNSRVVCEGEDPADSEGDNLEGNTIPATARELARMRWGIDGVEDQEGETSAQFSAIPEAIVTAFLTATKRREGLGRVATQDLLSVLFAEASRRGPRPMLDPSTAEGIEALLLHFGAEKKNIGAHMPAFLLSLRRRDAHSEICTSVLLLLGFSWHELVREAMIREH